jgi:hypothetical protein
MFETVQFLSILLALGDNITLYSVCHPVDMQFRGRLPNGIGDLNLLRGIR